MLPIPPDPLTPRQRALMLQLPGNKILDPTDPEKYPDQNDPDMDYDFVHFKHRGAEIFSRLFEEAFLKDHSRNY
jgi:hypothetical protein